MAAVWGLDQPWDQLPPMENSPVISAQCLDTEAQGAAGIAVEDVGAILLIHRDQLALSCLQVGDELPKTPSLAVVVTVEGKRVRGGLAELPEALLAVDVVAVGGHQQPAGAQLDPMPWAQREGGPLWGQGDKRYQWSPPSQATFLPSDPHWTPAMQHGAALATALALPLPCMAALLPLMALPMTCCVRSVALLQLRP